eukprot:345504-Rhodomonas_salina.2
MSRTPGTYPEPRAITSTSERCPCARKYTSSALQKPLTRNFSSTPVQLESESDPIPAVPIPAGQSRHVDCTAWS